MTIDDIPDGVPSEEEFDPQVNDAAMPRNHSSASPIQVGVDYNRGMVLMVVDYHGRPLTLGLPVIEAFQISQTLSKNALKLLTTPPPEMSGDDQPGLILPGK